MGQVFLLGGPGALESTRSALEKGGFHRSSQHVWSGGREYFGQGLCRGAPAERFSGAAVEAGGDLGEFLGSVDCEVGALGEVLAQQSIGVLVRAALPGRARVAEVDLDAGVQTQLDVLAQCAALVP